MADFRLPFADVRNSKLETRERRRCDPLGPILDFRVSNFGFPLTQSAISNRPSAMMSLSELGTSYPKIGHLGRNFRPPLPTTP